MEDDFEVFTSFFRWEEVDISEKSFRLFASDSGFDEFLIVSEENDPSDAVSHSSTSFVSLVFPVTTVKDEYIEHLANNRFTI